MKGNFMKLFKVLFAICVAFFTSQVYATEQLLSATVPSKSNQTTMTASSSQQSLSATPMFNALTAGVSGAWAGSAVGTTELYKGTLYSTPPISPVGSTVNSASLTTLVNWSYSYSRDVPGQRVWLCNYARCLEITDYKSGGTSAFYNDSAYSQFVFYFQVTGTGYISPNVFGGQDQVIVNYQ
jgi:hypothetical protein